jgi:alkylation response protein AidB-like acyl-CoA dehydrogenase
MEFLAQERTIMNEYLPGLDQRLATLPLLALEQPGNAGIRLFREAGASSLLIPRDLAGLGASALDAVRIQRALGSRSPSLAVATTMHHFSVATLVEMAVDTAGLEGILLEAIAQQRLLVASGFAEGRSGTSILRPTLQVQRVDGGFIINGSKKPCSLSYSMDLLTASIPVPGTIPGCSDLAVVLIPAASEGIQRRPFWANTVLGGAESGEVVLQDVFVPDRQLFHASDAGRIEPVQVSGFLWFELLISASYLGMASALAERVIQGARGEPVERVALGIEVEGAMAALEGVARAMMAGERGTDLMARLLFVRYAVQGAIERASARAVELLGGMAFVHSPEVSYLYAAARALAFHPPSRTSLACGLSAFLAGDDLQVP